MSASSSMTGRALRAVKWSYVGTIGRIVATFGSQIVLARLLGPESFGLFGYAFLTVMTLALFVQMGLQEGLVQIRELTPDVIGTAVGRLLLSGLIGSLGLFLSAGWIAEHLFNRPEATTVIQVMAPSLFVSAMTAAANAVLSRDIEFKVIQMTGLVSYVIGYLVLGISAAVMGMGVWSLVIAWYGFSVLSLLSLIWFAPHPLRPGNPFVPLACAKFGRTIMFANLATWAVDNAPHMVIGRWFGAVPLGYFTVANNLVKVPAEHLFRNLQPVLLSLSSRAQGNDSGLRRAYLVALAGLGLVAFPVFCFVAATATPITFVVLGAKWERAASLLTPLALAMIAHIVEGLVGPMLNGRGDASVEMRLKFRSLLLMIAAMTVMLMLSGSLEALAWTLTAVYVVRWLWMNAALMKRLGISGAAFLNALRGPACLGMATAAVSAAARGVATHAFGPGAHLAAMLAAIFGVASVCVLMLVAFPRLVLGADLLQLVAQLLESRPGLANRPVLRRIVQASRRGA